jgi:predicted membrane metal-binding protein
MPVQWRIRPALPVAKLIGAVAVLVLALAFGRHDPIQWVLAGALALALLLWAVRDFAVPVRLAAYAEGVMVVSGVASRVYLPWEQIERIQVDRRRRRGLSSELLEIDAGESLHLLTMNELGAHPEEVAAKLEALRAGKPLEAGMPLEAGIQDAGHEAFEAPDGTGGMRPAQPPPA